MAARATPPASLALGAARARMRGARRPGDLPVPAPFVLLFVLAPLSWFVGLGAFFWPAVAFAVLLAFLMRRRLEMPRWYGLWLLFLAWVPISAARLAETTDLLVFGQRYLGIASATLVFLLVFNASRRSLPDATVVDALAVYWAIIVVGGLLAAIVPTIEYHSPVERLVPAGLLQNAYVHGTFHVRFADVQTLLGFPVGRPMMFFGATNAWGAMVALLTPFAFAAMTQARTARHRAVLQALLVLSVIPIVVSLNRGLWIALAVAAAYVAVRFAVRRNLRWLAWAIAAIGVVAVLLLSTSLGDLVTERIATPHSNANRAALYEEALDGIRASPLIGQGGPHPSVGNPEGPPVGTHSYLLYLAYAHGLPALLLSFGWLGLTLVRSARLVTGARFWAHVTILLFLVQSPYYLLEGHLTVVMVAAALIWRSIAKPDPDLAPPSRR